MSGNRKPPGGRNAFNKAAVPRMSRPEITHKEAAMKKVYYTGLDIHKKNISYCIKLQDGTIYRQGVVNSERKALQQRLSEIPGAWKGAMEATMFSGWIYDFLEAPCP